MTITRFDTILVANRGEIACRVLRTARAMGYRTVAVYSDADATAPHVGAADSAVRIGPAPARDSYLDPDRIIDAAKRSGAQAIHPGYGFLSENEDFAQACVDAGLVFVGPTPDAIRVMGNKAAAKRLMAEAGVPMLPGYQGHEQNDVRLLAEADRIGLPLMVKAAAGGGGKGMRLVTEHAELAGALAAARREALGAFGSDVLILERALLRPRHIEIQVLGDQHGHVIALGERDCSIQRRHQKVVEEAPSPGVDPDLRAQLCAAAVAAAESVGYVGAGTVEFIVEDGVFSFLEMNTRLQVEHPVTELVTGLDLVEWQFRIAQGEPLDLGEVTVSGHAIEVRLYAEDPGNGFLPATGTVAAWRPPTGDGVRVDAGIATGSIVGTHYDPMLAKIIAHGRDRDEARNRLCAALQRTTLLGVATNRAFLVEVLRNPVFAGGEVTTAFLAEAGVESARAPEPWHFACAAAWLHRTRELIAARRSPGLAGWTNGETLPATMRLAGVEVTVNRDGDVLKVTVDDTDIPVEAIGDHLAMAGLAVDIDAVPSGSNGVLLRFPNLDLDVSDTLLDPPDTESAVGSGTLVAPMHGVVTAVSVAVGDDVRPGDQLVVLEAMKMERSMLADIAGRITEITSAGAQVAADDVLVHIRATPEDTV